MIIEKATIVSQHQTIALSGPDFIKDSTIRGGEISGDMIWFIGCLATDCTVGKNLGEKPPGPGPIVLDTNLNAMKLPDAYYVLCGFGGCVIESALEFSR